MGTLRSYEELEAWKRSRGLVREIYRVSKAGGLARDFALRDQMRKSAISVPSNIAEGFGREGRNEFVQFLSIAKGSLAELETQLYIALDQKYVTEGEMDSLRIDISEIRRMITGLSNYLKQSPIRGQKFNTGNCKLKTED